MGETFSGVDYEVALAAVEEIRKLVPTGMTMTQFALRWILMFDAVTCAIPGGKTAQQIVDNCGASDLPPLSNDVMKRVAALYSDKIAPLVHHRW